MKFSSGNATTRSAPAHKDLLFLSAMAAIVLALSLYFDAFDRFVHWYVRKEVPWRLEEIIVVIFFLSFGFAIFAYRRWRGLAAEIKIQKSERIEEALPEGSELLEAILESTADGILVVDESGKVIRANAKFFEMWQVPHELRATRDDLELLNFVLAQIREPEAFLAKVQALYGSSMEDFDTLHFLDGRVFERYSCPLIRGEKISGRVWSFQDVTERKRAEEVLRLTRYSVDHAADPIYWIGSEAQILYANAAACRSLGYSEEELLSMSVPDIDPYFDVEKWPDFFAQWKQGLNLTFETAHRRKDGSIFPIEVNINNMTLEGREFNFVFVKDISERKRAENEHQALEARLRQAHKMEAIGTLAGGIAHDFNNILAAIIGYTEIVLVNLSAHDPMRKELEQVLNAGCRARDLVKQILIFSRMKTVEAHRSVNVGQMVEEVLKFLRASLPTTIEIRRNIECKAGTTLADPAQIHELLINLCTNAGHAMEEKGGVLEVSLADADLDSNITSLQPDTKPGTYLRLTVSDTGHGMDAQTIEHIFEPYFTTREFGKGSGFGLAVVHGIVKRHGGIITVDSEPGKGTIFQVYLPSAGDTRSAEDEPEAPIPGGTERILFVDDEEMLTDIAKVILEKLGYRLLTLTNSMEALNVFRAHPDEFDLVVTDYTMPQMTGADLARKLLGIRPDIPIIICTGFSERITEEQAKEIGVEDFVMKPLNRRGLATVVRKALDKRSRL